MYAIEFTNLHTGRSSFTQARDYADAYSKKRFADANLEANGWHYGEDFISEVVEIDDDFDFYNQPDWN